MGRKKVNSGLLHSTTKSTVLFHKYLSFTCMISFQVRSKQTGTLIRGSEIVDLFESMIINCACFSHLVTQVISFLNCANLEDTVAILW